MKVSVIGGGAMGTNHARVLSELGVLDAVVESNEIAKKALADRFGRVASTVAETDSDAYVIATPSSTHFSIAYDLLQRGKHVLIEKPVCTNTDDALKLKAFDGQRIVTVGQSERYNPVVQYTKEWSQRNPLKIVNSYRLSPCPPRIKDVGVIMDLAIHDIDTQLHIVNNPVKSVYATAFYPEGSTNEHYGKIVLHFDNGTIGTIEASWLHSFRVRKMDVVSQTTCATVDYLQQTFTEQSSQVSGEYLNGFKLQVSSQRSEVALSKQEPLRLELENFLSAIQNNTKPFVTLDEATNALRVVEAAYASIQTGKVVYL